MLRFEIMKTDRTANLRTNMMDFRGFDSCVISMLRGGILMSTGDFPEDSSQEMLVGVMLVGGLGVPRAPEGGRISRKKHGRQRLSERCYDSTQCTLGGAENICSNTEMCLCYKIINTLFVKNDCV